MLETSNSERDNNNSNSSVRFEVIEESSTTDTPNSSRVSFVEDESQISSNTTTLNAPKFDRRKLLRQTKSQKSAFFGSVGNSMRNLFKSVKKVMRKKVTFDAIEIREHDMVLGDNPSCSRGPPVSMKWEHKAEFRMSLDEFEVGREGQRRNHQQLVLPRMDREKMLRENGVSRGEMDEVVKENVMIKDDNRRSYNKYVTRKKFVGSMKNMVPKRFRRTKSNHV